MEELKVTKRQKYYFLLSEGYSESAAEVLSGWDEHKEIENALWTWVKWFSVGTVVTLFGLYSVSFFL